LFQLKLKSSFFTWGFEMADSGVRFVRINGKVIPIKGSGAKSLGSKSKAKAPKAEMVMRFKAKNTSAAERAKDGAKAGAMVGGLIGGLSGLQFGLRGAMGGAAIGAAAIGSITSGLQAAFGRRKRFDVQMRIQKVKKTGV
jgi:hypothetical protein